MKLPLLPATLLTLLFSACTAQTGGPGDDRIPGIEDPDNPDVMVPDMDPVDPDPPPPVQPSPTDCDDAARWVYLVDTDRRLVRFQPDDLSLTVIGTLSCPSEPGASPFSMSVDRNAMAWVLYSSGELFRVSTDDASCSATGYVPNTSGMEVFGMGFATDGPMSPNETLYIAGGRMTGIGLGGGSSSFASLDLQNMTVQNRGTVTGWPELTGTGEGELWGFFPQQMPPRVQRVDKNSGQGSETYQIPLDAFGIEAWAFAFWGGRFYMFVKDLFDFSSRILRLDPETGQTSTIVQDSGFRIVGAGVSTCAPYELI